MCIRGPVLASIALLAAALSACSSTNSQVAAVANRYLVAVVNQDCDTLTRITAPGGTVGPCTDLPSRALSLSNKEKTSAWQTSVSGTRATATITMSQNYTVTVHLIGSDTRWRVVYP